MKLYVTVIGSAVALITLANLAGGTASWYGALALTLGCTAAQFALDGILAALVHRLPNRCFAVESPWYRVSKREQRLYNALRVRKWKDAVWELGGLGGFSKKNLIDPTDRAYIEQFIVECHKGVLTHRLSYFVGFLPMLCVPAPLALTVALPVATVNLILNVLPTIVLRHNTPKLLAVWRRMDRVSRQTFPPAGERGEGIEVP